MFTSGIWWAKAGRNTEWVDTMLCGLLNPSDKSFSIQHKVLARILQNSHYEGLKKCTVAVQYII